VAQWWNPYSEAGGAYETSLATARADGTLEIAVDGLARDVAVKVAPTAVHRTYLPLAVKANIGTQIVRHYP